MPRLTTKGIRKDAIVVLEMLSKEHNVLKLMSANPGWQQRPWADVGMSHHRDLHHLFLRFVRREWLMADLRRAVRVSRIKVRSLASASKMEAFFRPPTRQYTRDEIEYAKNFLTSLIGALEADRTEGVVSKPPKVPERQFVFELVD